MGFGSYDESEQEDTTVEADNEMSEKMKRARHRGEMEQEDEDLDELMQHL